MDGIESLVMQLSNIVVAYVLRRFYGLGKEDSRKVLLEIYYNLKDLVLKFLSSLIITLGILFPIVFE